MVSFERLIIAKQDLFVVVMSYVTMATTKRSKHDGANFPTSLSGDVTFKLAEDDWDRDSAHLAGRTLMK